MDVEIEILEHGVTTVYPLGEASSKMYIDTYLKGHTCQLIN